MTSKDKHQKHAFIAKPNLGQFARYECALLGAPCGLVEQIAKHIYDSLKEKYNIIYVDADHAEASDRGLPKLMDMISHHQLSYSHQLNEYDIKAALSHIDLALVNGNHFEARVQIPIIHKKKEDSLKRKLDRLTEVMAIIVDDCEEPYDFIKERVKDREVPIYTMGQLDQLAEFLLSKFAPVPVHGLVLAGGRSSRMGMDKSQINYHGSEQQVYMADLMQGLCHEVYISKRDVTDLPYPIITDSFTDLGPFGAIVSAFRSNPNVAWLITACDQPLLQVSHLKTLLQERDPSKMATCYFNPDTNFPEPLITLWEPKAYPKLLQFMALGYSCPRKVLINSDIKMIHVEDNNFMKNVNTPEERNELKATP